MNRYSDLEYLRLSRGQKFAYNFTSFFAGIPQALKNAGIGIGRFFQRIALAISIKPSATATGRRNLPIW